MTSTSPARRPRSAAFSKSSGPVVSKVRVIRIPAGKDPDELIRTDPDGWRQAVADAAELLPYFMQRAAGEVDMRQAQGRSGYTRRMLDLLRRLPDRVEQDSYVPQLAQLAGIDERILRDELARGERPVPIRPAVDTTSGGDAEGRLTPLERQALTLMLLSPTLAGELEAGERLPFRDESAQALGEAWRAAVAAEGKPDLERFVAGLDPATADLARSMLASARTAGRGPTRAAIAKSCASASFGCGSSASRSSSTTCRRSSEPPSTTRHPMTFVSWNNGSRRLTREREQLVREMKRPALVAGERRS